MHNTHNDIAANTRKKVVGILTPLLADCIDLYTQVKQAHWNVRGPSFQALHELFDSVATEVNLASDTIAERILQLGGEAEGTARSVAKHSRLKDYPFTLASGSEHVEALSKAMAGFLHEARKSIDSTDEAGDKVSADMCTSITRGLDKQLWFVEAHVVELGAKKDTRVA